MSQLSQGILLGAPLFILREECALDLFGVLKKLKALGFDGVEFLGFFGRTAEEIASMLEGLSLKAVGDHVPWNELSSHTDDVIKAHKLIGCKFITVGGIGKSSKTESGYPVKEFTEISAKCRENGIRLLFHNHAGELREKISGRTVLEDMLESIPEEALSLEPDLGWMQIGGADPKYFLVKYRDRCPVIHLKDFYLSDVSIDEKTTSLEIRKAEKEGSFEFRPIGYGISNTPMLMPYVLQCRPEWVVMDHDCAYERNPYEDLALSLAYVKRLMSL